MKILQVFWTQTIYIPRWRSCTREQLSGTCPLFGQKVDQNDQKMGTNWLPEIVLKIQFFYISGSFRWFLTFLVLDPFMDPKKTPPPACTHKKVWKQNHCGDIEGIPKLSEALQLSHRRFLSAAEKILESPNIVWYCFEIPVCSLSYTNFVVISFMQPILHSIKG